jgi:hypothetical protein
VAEGKPLLTADAFVNAHGARKKFACAEERTFRVFNKAKRYKEAHRASAFAAHKRPLCRAVNVALRKTNISAVFFEFCAQACCRAIERGKYILAFGNSSHAALARKSGANYKSMGKAFGGGRENLTRRFAFFYSDIHIIFSFRGYS